MQGLYFKFSEGALGKIGLSGKHKLQDGLLQSGAGVEYASLFSSSTNGCFTSGRSKAYFLIELKGQFS
jgi:hypothetical protein